MVSTLSGPIVTNSYHDKIEPRPYSRTSATPPPPRRRQDADGFNQPTRTGPVVCGLAIEGHTMPSAFKRNKAEPRDYMRENLRRLKQIQRETREKEKEMNQPVKALWKSSKYEHVESKVVEELNKELNAPRPNSANYLRAHSRTGFLPQSARPASVEPEEDQQTVPKAATARDLHLIRRDIDFVRMNGMSAKKYQMFRSQSVSSLDDGKRGSSAAEAEMHRLGEVPKYLMERKIQWLHDEKARRASIPDPEMPPGHRLMPEAERCETLEKIKQKHRELEQELASMPISNDSMRCRKRREDVEQKLAKVEEAIKIFSRQKVFVKLDS